MTNFIRWFQRRFKQDLGELGDPRVLEAMRPALLPRNAARLNYWTTCSPQSDLLRDALDRGRTEGPQELVYLEWADPEAPMAEAPTDEVYGLCTGCGSVEVRLNKADGVRDLSAIGESAAYPTGYGCEVCG